MGIFALLLIAAVLPLAWEVARRPRVGADPSMIWVIIFGLALTFLIGGDTGSLMSARLAHTVGPEGWPLRFLGWTFRGSGDIRIADVFGTHAMQALPLIAAAAFRAWPRWAGSVSMLSAIGYTLLMLGLLVQALRGQPFF